MVRFEVRDRNVRIIRDDERPRVVAHKTAARILRELPADAKWEWCVPNII